MKAITEVTIKEAFEQVCHAYCVPPTTFDDDFGSWKLHNPQPNLYTIVQIGHTTIDCIFPFSSDLLDEATFIRVCDAAIAATKIRLYSTFDGSHAMLSINLKMLSQTRFAVVEQGWTGNCQIVNILGVIRMGVNYARQSGFSEWVVEGYDRDFDDLMTAATVLQLMLQQVKRTIGLKFIVKSHEKFGLPQGERHFCSAPIYADTEHHVDLGSVASLGNKTWIISSIHEREDVPEHIGRLHFSTRDEAGEHLKKNLVLHSVYREFYSKYRRIKTP